MEEEALEFAHKAHATQKRKYSEEPYIEHPKRVAALVKTVPHTPEMVSAAYLHDVVEDTPVELEEIEDRFGSRVAALVNDLTDHYTKGEYPHLNRRSRKKKEVERQAHISVEAKTIKLADIIDNTMDIVKNDLDFARIYVREMEALVSAVKEGDPLLLKQASHEVEKGKSILRNQRQTQQI